MSTSSRIHNRHAFTGVAFTVAVTMAMLAAATNVAAAQSSASETTKFEFRIASGALVATGDQRDFIKDAQVTAAQLSWLVRPSLAVTGTFGWARSRDIASVDDPKLDIFNSDLGIEVRPAQWFADRAVSFSPFVGLGAGVRSYNYRKLDVDATNNLAGYATIGGELGIGRVGLRLDVRNYVTGFKPLVGAGKSDTRSDVQFLLGMRFNRKRATPGN